MESKDNNCVHKECDFSAVERYPSTNMWILFNTLADKKCLKRLLVLFDDEEG